MNIERIVTQALKKISVPCVQLFWNDEKNIPNQYVTWVEISRKSKVCADDSEILEEFYISVDIFSKYGISYTKLIEEIETNMKLNGFLKSTYATAKYEKDTGYVHKPLSFKYYKQK